MKLELPGHPQEQTWVRECILIEGDTEEISRTLAYMSRIEDLVIQGL